MHGRAGGRRKLAWIAAGVVALSMTASASMAASGTFTAPTPVPYVALGDSYAAGPAIPPPDLGGLLCQRSKNNYPNVAATALGATLTDASCIGATIADLTVSQRPSIPPQFDALTSDTRLVSLTIGGNDVGLLQLALGCINLLPPPLGVSCAKRYTAGGVDQYSTLIAQVAPRVGSAIDAIRQRAPQAKVLVVGYGTILPPNGCYPITPLFPSDATYIQAKVDELDDALGAQAAEHGATFVDTRAPGHDVCKPRAARWFEGYLPLWAAAPLHPNASGMRTFGAQVAAAVAAPIGAFDDAASAQG